VFGEGVQRIEILNRESAPFVISAATFDRIRHAAQGREGGEPGQVGAAYRRSGLHLKDKGVHVIGSGDSLVVELPGGGGFGDAGKRSEALIAADGKAELA